LPTVGAKTEIRGQHPAPTLWAARSASIGRGSGPARFIENSATPIAFQEALSPLDRNERNKEQAQIVVEPLEAGRGQATLRTEPRLIICFDFPWLNSTNKQEESASPPAIII